MIFAGGGSGGHLSPGLAINERVREITSAPHAMAPHAPTSHALAPHVLAPHVRAMFLCSNRAIDTMMLGEAGVRFAALPATPPAVRPAAAWRFVRNFRASTRLAREIMLREQASCVVALGGFVAAPIVKAARALGVPALLVNLDSPPGKANRWMAKFCDEVVSAVDLPTMPRFASRVVGLPVRRRAIAPASAAECRARLGLSPDRPTLLVTGASQGAISINDLMVELARSEPAMFDGWQVLHISGHGADEPLRAAYRQAGIDANVQRFVHEMGLAWGAADLAISRAGANSVAEIAVNAVPSVLLPYPYHKDMHQRHNARPLVELPGGGGAVMEDDRIDAGANARHLSPILRSLMGDESRRSRMRAALRGIAGHDAAMTIARMVIDRIEGQRTAKA